MNPWSKIIKSLFFGVFCTLFCNMLHAAPNLEGIQVYQKNVHLSPEHKQILADDIDRYRNNGDNMWDILRSEFILPHYEDNPLVQYQIQWFMNHQDFLIHSATRAAPYLYYIFQQLKKRHLPAELVLLPMIESAYNPFAYSTAGAGGIWQMMPSTASGYGIKQNWWYDGRRDVVASTGAALNHLSYLASFFQGNWLLAIAAYNTGEGNVLAAIRKNISNGNTVDFWSLPLAQETREYIPRLLALATIISHPYRYPINFPGVRNAPYLAQVDVGGQIDLKQAAYLAGLSLQAMKHFNPGYNHSTTDPNGPFKLVLPIENVEQFTENLERSPIYQQVNLVRYKIKSRDTLYTIAKHFNTTPGMLRKMNPILASNLKPGAHLMIPRSNATPEISKMVMEAEQPRFVKTNNVFTYAKNKNNSMQNKALAENVSAALVNLRGPYKMQPGDTLYMVRRNDDIKKISKHFHISPKALLAINHLHSSNIRPGVKLIIPTHSINNTKQQYQLTPGDTVYMVRQGDTIEKIARHFHTTPAAIRLANLLASNHLQEGDQLVVPTHG